MGKIFCIMGKSCSGKDSIYKELLEDKDLNLVPIITYTTRPKRSNEVDGKNYNFISSDYLLELDDEDKIIEYRMYDTVKGIWYYATVDDGQVDLESDKNYIIINTLKGFRNLRDYYGKDLVIPLYIDVENEIRLQRAFDREKSQHNPDYKEMCRRFIVDEDDYEEYKLLRSNVDKWYINNKDLKNCSHVIKEDILRILNK